MSNYFIENGSIRKYSGVMKMTQMKPYYFKMKDLSTHIEINRVKTIRKHLNLTQAELAPLLGVSLKTIKNWEQGTRKPSKAALMLLELELKKITS